MGVKVEVKDGVHLLALMVGGWRMVIGEWTETNLMLNLSQVEVGG